MSFSLILSLFAGISAALAAPCALDDCDLPTQLHEVELTHFNGTIERSAPDDGWSWMNHRLAEARVASQRGDDARVIQIARSLDTTLRLQLPKIADDRGLLDVRAFHEALNELVVDAGGFALSPLPDRPGPLQAELQAGPPDRG